MPPANDLNTLRENEYRLRIEAARLRREVFEQPDPAASATLLEELLAAEKMLAGAEKLRAEAQAQDPQNNGTVFSRRTTNEMLGPETTGLDARVQLRMAQVPTAIYHLFDPDENPLVSCFVDNVSHETRRLRVTSYIEGYSSKAVDTVELEAQKDCEFKQLPSLFPQRVRNVNELTRATLNVKVEDLDGKGMNDGNANNVWGGVRTEIHKTQPIWLLARTTAPLSVQDPATGKARDMTRYFGAFVTPNAPKLMSFLRTAAENHAEKRLRGYQGDKNAGVKPQVEAIFNALKTDARLTYVNSVIAFSPEEGALNQRVRLPRESLKDEQANCIDGTVLFASLLEAASLNPAIVVVPGHAFVAWETWDKSGEWDYLETTMIGSHNFQQAHSSGQSAAKLYKAVADETKNEVKFRFWPLRDLRATHRITPME